MANEEDAPKNEGDIKVDKQAETIVDETPKVEVPKVKFSSEVLLRILGLKSINVDEIVKRNLEYKEKVTKKIVEKLKGWGDPREVSQVQQQSESTKVELTPNQKVDRAFTMVVLRLNGVANPEKLIKVFVENVDSSQDVYKNIRQRAKHFGEISNLDLVIERLIELKQLEVISNVASKDFRDILNRIAHIPEETFNSFMGELKQFKGIDFEKYTPYVYFSDNSDEKDVILEKIVSAAEIGKFDETTKVALDLAEKLYSLTKLPFSLEGAINNAENVGDSIVVINAICSKFREEYYTSSKAMELFVNSLVRNNTLHEFAESLSLGIDLDSSIINEINGVYGENKQEGDWNFIQLKDLIKETNAAAKILKGPMREVFLVWAQTNANQNNENSQELKGFYPSQIRDFEYRISKMQEIYNNLEGFPENKIEELIRLYLKGDSLQDKLNIVNTGFDLGFVADSFFKDIMVSINRNKFVQTLKKFIYGKDSYTKPEFQRFSSVLTEIFPVSERGIWNLIANCHEEEKEMVLNNKDLNERLLTASKDGKITSEFIQIVATEVIKDPESLVNYLKNISSELKNLDEPQRSYWQLVIAYSDHFGDYVKEGYKPKEIADAKVILISKMIRFIRYADLFVKDGLPTPEFFESMVIDIEKNIDPESNIKKIFLEELGELLPDSVLEGFNPEVKGLWKLFKENKFLRSYLFLNKDKLGPEITEDGKLTLEGIKYLVKRVVINAYENPNYSGKIETSEEELSLINFLKTYDTLGDQIRVTLERVPSKYVLQIIQEELESPKFYIDDKGRVTLSLVKSLAGSVNNSNSPLFNEFVTNLSEDEINNFSIDGKKYWTTWRTLPQGAKSYYLAFPDNEILVNSSGKLTGKYFETILEYAKQWADPTRILNRCCADMVLPDGTVDINKIDLSDLPKDKEIFWSNLLINKDFRSFMIKHIDSFISAYGSVSNIDIFNKAFSVLKNKELTGDYLRSTSVDLSFKEFIEFGQIINAIPGNVFVESKGKLLKQIGKMSVNVAKLTLNLLGIDFSADDTDFKRFGDNRTSSNERSWRESTNVVELKKKLEASGLTPEAIKTAIEAYHHVSKFIEKGEFIEILKKVSNVRRSEVIGAIKKAVNIDLDSTSEEFLAYNERLGKTRKIPSFKSVWGSRILENLNNLILESASRGEQISYENLVINNLLLYGEGFDFYQLIQNDLMPKLNEMHEKINDKIFGQGVWFSGRDGVPLYLSVKAAFFGVPLGDKESFRQIILEQIKDNPEKKLAVIKLGSQGDLQLEKYNEEEIAAMFDKGLEVYLKTETRIYDLIKYVAISRLVFEKNQGPKEIENVKRLLLSKGINPSMLGVDTGNVGSVMNAAMNLFGGMTRSNMILWGKGGDINSSYEIVEKLPKKSDRTLLIDEDGNPVRVMNPLDTQLLSWVCDHAIIREYIPKQVKKDSENAEQYAKLIKAKREKQLTRIAAIETIMSKCSELGFSQEETFKIVDLYVKTHENLSPVITGFAHKLLTELSAKDKDSKLVFAGRDGLGTFEVASILLDKFPNLYPNVSKDQLKYMLLTRKIVIKTETSELQQYFEQEGIQAGDKVTLVDVGMFGTINTYLNERLPQINWQRPEYLISKTPLANGYIYDGKEKSPKIFNDVPGNPAVHFLEDTFSGELRSPSSLVLKDGKLYPNTIIEEDIDGKNSYPEEIKLTRTFALKALDDYAKEISRDELTHVVNGQESHLLTLINFLSDKSNFENLLVPHD